MNPKDPIELESRAAERAEEDPAAGASLYLELAAELGEAYPEAAADHAARASELFNEAGDVADSNRAALEAAYYDGLATPRRLKRSLERLEHSHLAAGESLPALRSLHAAARRLGRRLAESGARAAASRASELAWAVEHRLVRRRGGVLKRAAYGLWRLTAGYGERPLRLVVTALVVVYLFGLLYIGVNYLGGGGAPAIVNLNLYDLFGYFGVSLAAFLGGGFTYAGNALGWALVCLEAVLGWLVTLTLVTLLVRRLLR
ncbi:MAG: hypothetical protein GF403_01065 [Candidatus Coatesbacteria bacterium]|nr:hypothetical protein [Candidatus Coatesbacteria bacterium]